MESLLEKNELIRKFALGMLSDSEMEEAVACLAKDDTSLAALEALWLEGEASLPAQHFLDKEKARRLEKYILTHLNRAHLATNMITLGTRGFLSAAAGLLRPFLSH